MARRTARGERPKGGARAVKRSRGMALVIVLVAVTLLSLATLAPLRNEQQALQRERETELLFIGEQFRQAIASYAAVTPAGAARFPKSLTELLEDKRFPNVRRHLRRVYADPFSGAADWTLVTQQGAIVGVASRSTREPLKRSGFTAADRAFAEATSYAGWIFTAQPGANGVGAGTVPTSPSGPTAPAPPTDTAPPTAEPKPNPVQDARRECARVYFAALNACVLDQATSTSCRSAARDTYRTCLGG
jgi:type II secretory pathway pseudopilin PulG